MSDNDLIRRGDALAAVYEADSLELVQHGENRIADRIAALEPVAAPDPAVTVGVVDVEQLARLLFPDDYHDGRDCRGEVGREGQPCAICAGKIEWWSMRVKQVSDALAALEPVAAPDPALRPTMTDMMVDPDTLDAFMEAKPLPPDPAAIRILALIQKGGDACDKDDDPANARPATSPGVTAGAISKGAADDS